MAGKKNYELEILISGGTDASLSASIRKARKELDTLEQKAGISAKNVNDSFGGMSVKGIDALGSASDFSSQPWSKAVNWRPPGQLLF